MVAATEQRSSTSNVTITYQGGQDAGLLQGLGAQVDGGTITWVNSSTTGTIPVGTTKTISAGNPGRNYVVITGYFTDGSVQVISQNTL